ncbi:ArsC/Spx/MgsR family protein [Candidatus Parabeggiatoa sp. HSG14]|uniref:arsenate reductase family protein n=1 Tax=Candidatus Parabeggiatoa sp. HSG14 TaxID=3055593 RepID=UPI0025A7F1DD|nr:ArsC/Spx/MgsR family protein [Thiotrichales bacterium HSG14]
MKVIYNPNCSKCKTLGKALENRGINWENVAYLNTGLTSEMVAELFAGYEGNWRDLVREKEDIFKDEGLNPQEMLQNDMMDFLVKHPIAIQRPLVIKDKEIIIARDAEGIHKVIG